MPSRVLTKKTRLIITKESPSGRGEKMGDENVKGVDKRG